MQQQGVGVGAVLPGIVVSAFHWDRQGLLTTAIPSLQSTCLVQQSLLITPLFGQTWRNKKASFRELRLAHLLCTNFVFIRGLWPHQPERAVEIGVQRHGQ